MRHDRFSLRDYLSFVEGQDPETIHWLETIDSATGWFNMAFTENVLESLAFDYLEAGENPDPPSKKIVGKDGKPLKAGKWYCVEGGTEEVIHPLEKKFHDKISYNTRVTKMALYRKWIQGGEDESYVHIDYMKGKGEASEPGSNKYTAVINTTTLAALQKMDLTEMELPYRLKSAIRSLHYDTSTKVGMKFKYPWWIVDNKITEAGLGKTDMPLRVW